ncbi:type I-B CRISPR-associated endonuclease Cas1b [Senegalia massiliensis]|uniref:type I-B CRISPR-associated endonuclease Cas1b n=1 Tax=Senegalia massiliensis TaxID=1720316 RepID=UPI001A918856|nr:type I-B CRISPR-associated endonuclease Cas1b [Senegalia massiliensis]
MSRGELKRKDNSIVFKNEKGNFYIPIEGIRELYCMNDMTVTTKLLDFISKAGVVIHFFNYYGHYSGTYYPKKQLISGSLKIKQATTYLDRRLIIAKKIVEGIAVNIAETLYHYYKHGKKDIKPLIDWLRKDIPNMLSKEINIKQILFIEGQIWQNFYATFKNILREEFVFNKRVKRPPDNPLNAMISFGNSLLYTKTISQIYNTHLDQSISFLHEPMEGRFSLSLDIAEVFKPIIVFKTIFDLVNNRKIRVDKHFEKKVNYCILNEKGRKIFIQEFENRINSVFLNKRLNRKTTYLTAIKLDVYKLIKYIVEDKEFVPFNLKESC